MLPSQSTAVRQSANQNIESIQVARGVASLLVLFFHVNVLFESNKYWSSKPLGDFFDFGHAGVEIFFVLSGMVMMIAHSHDLGNRHALRNFIYRRFSRIYPTYWAVLLPIIVAHYLIDNLGFGYERNPLSVLSSLLLVNPGESRMILGVAWTLCYEVVFYVLFALLIFNKRLGLFALGLFAVFGLASLSVLAGSGENHSSYYLLFIAGLFVGARHNSGNIREIYLLPIGFLIFLAAAYLNMEYFPGRTGFISLMYGVGFSVAIASLISIEKKNNITFPAIVLSLGDASYSLYLTHTIILSLYAKIFFRLNLDALFGNLIAYFLAIILCVGFSLLFYRLVEAPILRAMRKNLRRFALGAISERRTS